MNQNSPAERFRRVATAAVGLALAWTLMQVNLGTSYYVSMLDDERLLVLDWFCPPLGWRSRDLRVIDAKTGELVSRKRFGSHLPHDSSLNVEIGIGRSFKGHIAVCERVDADHWRLMLVDPWTMDVVVRREMEIEFGYGSGLCFSSDGRWLAWMDQTYDVSTVTLLLDAESLETVDQTVWKKSPNARLFESTPSLNTNVILVPTDSHWIDYANGKFQRHDYALPANEYWNCIDFSSRLALFEQRVSVVDSNEVTVSYRVLEFSTNELTEMPVDEGVSLFTIHGDLVRGQNSAPTDYVFWNLEGKERIRVPVSPRPKFHWHSDQALPARLSRAWYHTCEIWPLSGPDQRWSVYLGRIPPWSFAAIVSLCIGWPVFWVRSFARQERGTSFWCFGGILLMSWVVVWSFLIRASCQEWYLRDGLEAASIALIYCAVAYAGIELASKRRALLERISYAAILVSFYWLDESFFLMSSSTGHQIGMLATLAPALVLGIVMSLTDRDHSHNRQGNSRRWQTSVAQWLVLMFAVALAIRVFGMRDWNVRWNDQFFIGMAIVSAAVAMIGLLFKRGRLRWISGVMLAFALALIVCLEVRRGGFLSGSGLGPASHQRIVAIFLWVALARAITVLLGARFLTKRDGGHAVH